jgi:predicted O-methyltransferase YrrM
MEKFFERIEMPQRKYSKAIRVLKFLDKDKNFKNVDYDLQAAQSLKIEDSFPLLFQHVSQSNRKVNIIEIGTFKGGLTVIIDTYAKLFDLDYTLTTFDIKDRLIQEETKAIFRECGIDFVLENTLSKTGHEKIKSIIEDDAICLIFCDGGNKTKEISDFSKLMKKKDIILGHDYGYNSVSFSKKEWTAFELSFNGIRDAFHNNGLTFLLKSEMEESVWFCAEREK